MPICCRSPAAHLLTLVHERTAGHTLAALTQTHTSFTEWSRDEESCTPRWYHAYDAGVGSLLVRTEAGITTSHVATVVATVTCERERRGNEQLSSGAHARRSISV